jgi:SSS family solute:Na+ symporter
VVYTETIQAIILLLGATATLIYGLIAVGGWNQMVATAGPGFMNIWKPATHSDFPWTGVVFGAPILGIWYWCTDQNIVQRVLSAKNVSEARKGTIFAGFLKLTPLFLFVIPGVIAFCLTQPGVPEGVRLNLASKDSALPELVKTLLPSGLKGMVGAALLAALMSSLASVFNSASTLVTLDIYQKLYPNSEEKQLVRFGQITTVALVVIGLAFIPLIDNFGDTLFVSLQAIQAMVAPPIAAVFLFGIFFKRLNKEGALASLGAGFIFGMGRFIMTNFGVVASPGTALDLFLNINFLHFAFYLFVLCSLVLFIVSYNTPEPDPEKIKGLTYVRTEPTKELTFESVQKMTQGVEDRFYSVLLVVAVIAVWILFA